LVGGALFSRVFRADRIRLLTPGTLLASSALAAALSINVSWLTATVLILVFSFSIATTISIGITYRQLAAPDHLRSSVNVIGRMVAWGVAPSTLGYRRHHSRPSWGHGAPSTTSAMPPYPSTGLARCWARPSESPAT